MSQRPGEYSQAGGSRIQLRDLRKPPIVTEELTPSQLDHLTGQLYASLRNQEVELEHLNEHEYVVSTAQGCQYLLQLPTVAAVDLSIILEKIASTFIGRRCPYCQTSYDTLEDVIAANEWSSLYGLPIHESCKKSHPEEYEEDDPTLFD